MSLFLDFEDAPVASPSVQLRPYQEACVTRILEAYDSEVRSGLVVLPTGCGKTLVIAETIRRLALRDDAFRAVMIAHRAELLEQGAAAIRRHIPSLRVGIEAGDVCAEGYDRVVLAGVQTVGRANARLRWLKPSLVATDEAHHASAASYGLAYRKFGAAGPDRMAFHLGVTATAHRMDNKPLHGEEGGPPPDTEPIFERVLYRYGLKDAIRDGWLVDLVGYRIETGADLTGIKTTGGDYQQGQLSAVMGEEAVVAAAFAEWHRLASDRKTVVFCAGVEASRSTAAFFERHGVPAVHVDGEMRPEARAAAMESFRSGRVRVLTNVDIATEGFDVPDIGCVLLLRPTLSWSLFTQMVGRGTRLAAGKVDCLILDAAGNTSRHSLGKQPANLAGMIGLPDGIDLQGKALVAAADEWEALGEAERAFHLDHAETFADIATRVEPIDLLLDATIPDELAESRLAWLKVGEDEYRIHLGGGAKARMRLDELGRVWLMATRPVLGEDGEPTREEAERFIPSRIVGDSLEDALARAEREILTAYPTARSIATRTAKWRSEKASDKQIAFLVRKKIPREKAERLSRGDAQTAISRIMAGGGA